MQGVVQEVVVMGGVPGSGQEELVVVCARLCICVCVLRESERERVRERERVSICMCVCVCPRRYRQRVKSQLDKVAFSDGRPPHDVQRRDEQTTLAFFPT